jgi:hypothetical protein
MLTKNDDGSADTAALMRLRDLLFRTGQWPAVYSYSSHRVVSEVARLLDPALFGLASAPPVGESSRGGWPMAAAGAASAVSSSAAAASSIAAGAEVVNLNAIAVPALPVVPLLPALEEVQMEGAEVLPEIEESLDNINSSLGSVDTASVSMTPAPSKVPEIQTSMTSASSNITSTLNAL